MKYIEALLYVIFYFQEVAITAYTHKYNVDTHNLENDK